MRCKRENCNSAHTARWPKFRLTVTLFLHYTSAVHALYDNNRCVPTVASLTRVWLDFARATKSDLYLSN